MPSFAIGVDLGGTNLRISAVDEQAQLLEKVTTGTQVKLGRDHVINEMCRDIQALTSKFERSHKLMGIGIGVPGIIDMHTGMLHQSPNLPGWHDYPVRDEIERRLQTRVVLENDANAAAVGEHWLGAAKGLSGMCMLTLGTGVGGGLVLDGMVWHGMTGMAGELGHINIEPDGQPCGCGNRGCLEQYASATAVMRMARESIASGRAPELARAAGSDPEFSAKVIFNLALQGDGPAKEVFQRVGSALGIGLAALVNALNLPMYVIGGGVSSAWEAFAPAMFEEMRKRSFVFRATTLADPKGAPALGTHTIVTQAVLGSDAGLYGAARLPMLAGNTVHA